MAEETTFPVWLWIDPTRRCNLKCTFCYTKQSHATDDLTVENLNLILDNIELTPSISVRQITLNWRGEPFMNKNFLDLLKTFERRAKIYDLQFHTNATLLSDKIINQLLEIDYPFTLYLSIDGGSEASHDKHRGEGTFQKAIRGAKRLLELRGDSTNPKVGLYQLLLMENPSNYDKEFNNLVKEVDYFQSEHPILPDGNHKIFTNSTYANGGSELINSWQNVGFEKIIPKGPCFWAGNTLNISPSGNVHICILSHSTDGIIGNILKEPVTTILARAKLFRQQIYEKERQNISHCSNCSKIEGDYKL